VKSFSVSFNALKQKGICFVETRSPLLDSDVRELDAFGFGNIVCIEFSFAERVAESTREVLPKQAPL
jgi:hypothetical protein